MLRKCSYDKRTSEQNHWLKGLWCKTTWRPWEKGWKWCWKFIKARKQTDLEYPKEHRALDPFTILEWKTEENKSIYLRHSVCSNWHSRNEKFSMGYVEKQNTVFQKHSHLKCLWSLHYSWCDAAVLQSTLTKLTMDTCKSLDTSPHCSMFKIMEHL